MPGRTRYPSQPTSHQVINQAAQRLTCCQLPAQAVAGDGARLYFHIIQPIPRRQ